MVWIKYRNPTADNSTYLLGENPLKLGNCGRALLNVDEEDIKLDGSFDVPEGVTRIGEWAFDDCMKLKTLMLSQAITFIDKGAFEGCRNLHTLTLPEKITSIRNFTFVDCRSLLSLNLPEGITSIGIEAFCRCISLHTLILPKGITSIDKAAFADCSSIRTLTIPEGVTSISESTFMGCSNVRTLTLPKGITSIGNLAFEGCSKLDMIVIDSEDVADIERITELLPDSLRSKVVTPAFAHQIDEMKKKHCIRIANEPKTYPFYIWLNRKNQYNQKLKNEPHIDMLPNELVPLISSFYLSDTPYYRHAKKRMNELPVPKDEEGFNDYNNRLKRITDEVIDKVNTPENSESSTKCIIM